LKTGKKQEEVVKKAKQRHAVHVSSEQLRHNLLFANKPAIEISHWLEEQQQLKTMKNTMKLKH